MTAKIICGDARQLIRTVVADALITDPVWPNCPPELLIGWENPVELLGDVLAAAPDCLRRLVIILRSDSDPRFLAAVPKRWKFVCVQAMSYAVPMYLGRVLGGTELAYCFGEPIPSAEGRRVIPMWGPKAQPGNRKANGHPCSPTDWKGGSSGQAHDFSRLRSFVHSGKGTTYPNPAYVEAMMGFPPGWTVCEASATPSSRKSLKSSDEPS